ncbi:PAS domain-containing sensor histidine kinase [Chryseobacterium koreense]|uniref:PAS domain-containing sensor histidine kinase n=1 Tax=Chryseobacterium koreense TaxID=232216 RepID=UPI0026E93014|nr:PAS domain-containing sensor histidine kinase [Chryseobacterium koreense]
MENAKLLHSIITAAPDGIIITDSEGTIERVNPAVLKLFGYEEAELIGKNITLLVPKGFITFRENYAPKDDHTQNSVVKSNILELTGLRKNRTTFPIRLVINQIEYQNRFICTGFIHDLTGEKKAESILKKYTGELEVLVQERTKTLEQTVIALQKTKENLKLSLEKEQEANRLKSRFVSIASHEFRTPLSSMQLSVVLIEKYLEEPDRPQILKHLFQLKNALGNLNHILNDFLSLEKLEVADISPVTESFDVMEFAEELTAEMQLITKTNQIITYRHKGSAAEIQLDRYLIRHCLVNLITNSVKYSGENTLIEFSTEITDHHYLFTVKDNGMGIPAPDQPFIFQPFFRAHNTGKIPGTGLGLNIVERYVKLMNGEVQFSSSPGQGTEFILSFRNTYDKN